LSPQIAQLIKISPAVKQSVPMVSRPSSTVAVLMMALVFLAALIQHAHATGPAEQLLHGTPHAPDLKPPAAAGWRAAAHAGAQAAEGSRLQKKQWRNVIS